MKPTMTEETKKRIESGAEIIVSFSGGKDSTATCLFLFELGFSKNDFKRVYFDTGWESPITYEYIDSIQDTIGEVEVLRRQIDIKRLPKTAQNMIKELEDELGHESPFIRLVFENHSFPSHYRKFCTRELKIEVFQEFVEKQDNDFINAVGVRREESSRRSTVEEWEWNDSYHAWVWRPLYLWKEKDVIDIHHRFGVTPNSLYLNGHHRVGCFPCIYQNKGDIANLPASRVAFIAKFEKYLGEFLQEHTKNEKVILRLNEAIEKKGYVYRSFFSKEHIPIDDLLIWSKTSRGGKQFKLFDLEEPSCAKWGMCDFSGGK